jgi:hypothetical protein
VSDIEEIRHDAAIRIAAADALVKLAQQNEQTARGESAILRTRLRAAEGKSETLRLTLNTRIEALEADLRAVRAQLETAKRTNGWRARAEAAA